MFLSSRLHRKHQEMVSDWSNWLILPLYVLGGYDGLSVPSQQNGYAEIAPK